MNNYDNDPWLAAIGVFIAACLWVGIMSTLFGGY